MELEKLTNRGLSIFYDKGDLVVSPAEKITDDIRAFIRDNKPQLIAEIMGKNCQRCGYLNTKFLHHYCMSPQVKRFTQAATPPGEPCPQWVSSWAIGWRDWNN